MRETAALSTSVQTALLKVLYGVMVALATETAPSPSRRRDLQNWLTAAGPAIKKFSLTSLPALVKDTLANSEVETELVGDELRAASSAFKGELDIKADTLKMFRAFATWYRVGSDRAYEALAKSVSTLGDTSLTQDFVKEVKSQAPSRRALKAIVKAVTKRDDTALTGEELQKLKQKNLDLFREYQRLRKEFNSSWKLALQTFVRESGSRLVDFNSVVQYLNSQKFDFNVIEGFEGKIDDAGKLYTTKGKLINGVPNAAMFPYVVMNPKYNPSLDDSYVFLAKKADGTNGNFFYTAEYKQRGTKEKFGNVSQLKDKIKAMRTKWIPAINEGISNPDGVFATMLEILLQYSARIGSAGNSTDGKATYGLSTLKVSALKLGQGKATLAYKGKDGVAQKHVIQPSDSTVAKQLIANLTALADGKKPGDPLFTITRTKVGIPVRAVMVNKYFKRLGAGQITVHKLRTLRGTLVFEKEMEAFLTKLGDKASGWTDAQARAAFMKLAVKVGGILGHVRTLASGGTKVTGATALQAYIDPSVQIEFWRRIGKRPPKYLEKFV